MIGREEAEEMADTFLRVLYKKLTARECEHCGAVPVTAAELNVFRQALKDNEFRSIDAPGGYTGPGITQGLPFPEKAAHA